MTVRAERRERVRLVEERSWLAGAYATSRPRAYGGFGL
jgi:hypothetical protein